MPGRGVAQGARLGVEHDDRGGDELLVTVAGRQLLVELLERLGRITELPQEDAQQILGLERRDRRLDAVTGDVADDRGDPGRPDAVHVEEVTGHQARTGLVHTADLETGEVRDLLGREPSRPRLRRQLLLLERLTGTPFDVPPVASHAGFTNRQPSPPQRGERRHRQDGEEHDEIGVVRDGDRGERRSEHAVDDRRVGFLAIGRERQRMGLDVAFAVVVDEVDDPQAQASRADVHHRGHQTDQSGGQKCVSDHRGFLLEDGCINRSGGQPRWSRVSRCACEHGA